MMKPKSYSVALARQHLAEVLDVAEGGEEVVIERRGVRFAVRVLPAAPRPSHRPRVEILDPEVETGSWSWSWSPTSGAELASTASRAAPAPGARRRRSRAAS